MDPATDANLAGSQEATGSDDAWSVLDALNDAERRFVRKALLTGNYSEAASSGGWDGEDAPARVLGRPKVREALMRLAPLFMADDPKRIARLMLPFWGGKLLETAIGGSDAQATTAAKELSSLAGLGATKVEHLHASLADVLAALNGRVSAELTQPPEPKRLESRKSEPDTESGARETATRTLEAIWDPVAPEPSPSAGKPRSSSAKAGHPAAAKKGGRRKTTP